MTTNEMKRRTLLGTLGTGIAGALAGCSSLIGEDTKTTETQTPTETPTATETQTPTPTPSPLERARSHLNDAYTEINRVGIVGETFVYYSAEEFAGFSLESVEADLTAAHDALNKAEAQTESDTERSEVILNLSFAGVAAEAAAKRFAALADELKRHKEWEQLMGEEEYDKALEKMIATRKALSRAKTYNQKFADLLAKLKGKSLAIEAFDYEHLHREERILSNAIYMMEATTYGLKNFTSAWGGYARGIEYVEQEKYEIASRLFAASHDRFKDAQQNFTTAEERKAVIYDEQRKEYDCKAPILADAMTYYSEWATALKNGNTTKAEDRKQKAEQKVKEAESCEETESTTTTSSS